MNWAPLSEAAAPIFGHALAAFAALVLGAFQLALKKGGRRHVYLGYLWAGLMFYIALSGLFIHELRVWGRFSPIHLLSFGTMIGVIVAIYRARKGQYRHHKYAMILTYAMALVITFFFTFWPGRVMYHVFFGSGAS